ncbi:MAG: ubiquitin-like domain-containing protein [Streptosporangiales bacterium]
MAAVLAGGGAAYAAIDKDVTLNVDGKSQTVHTFSGDVSSILQAADVQASKHDLVAPGKTSTVGDGDKITVRHGRQITVTVDGKQKKEWVTALTVKEALDQLGLHKNGLEVSADRSHRIPLDGMSFSVRLPKDVTVVTKDKKHKVTTNAVTVAGAVEDAGVNLHKHDIVKPKRGAHPVDGDKITVKRVKINHDVRKVEIDPQVTKKETDNLDQGDTKVKDPGTPGLKKEVWVKRTVDGDVTKNKKVSEKVLRKPESKVVLVGTAEPEPAAPPSSGGTVDGSGSFWTLGGMDWKGLASCESGMNPQAVNPNGHYGLYQFSLPTWHSVGGSGNPVDASAVEQTQRAYTLYQRAGAGQWACSLTPL